jgi:hypothetical protein
MKILDHQVTPAEINDQQIIGRFETFHHGIDGAKEKSAELCEKLDKAKIPFAVEDTPRVIRVIVSKNHEKLVDAIGLDLTYFR